LRRGAVEPGGNSHQTNDFWFCGLSQKGSVCENVGGGALPLELFGVLLDCAAKFEHVSAPRAPCCPLGVIICLSEDKRGAAHSNKRWVE